MGRTETSTDKNQPASPAKGRRFVFRPAPRSAPAAVTTQSGDRASPLAPLGTINFIGRFGLGNCGHEAFRAVHRALFPDCTLNWYAEVPKIATAGSPIWVLGDGDALQDEAIRQVPPEAPFFLYGADLSAPGLIERVAGLRHRIAGAWVRDPREAEALRRRGVEARYTPDVAFQLAPVVRDRDLPREAAGRTRKKAVFIPSNAAAQSALSRGDLADFFYLSYLKIKLGTCLDEIAKFYDLLFLPFSFELDNIDLSFVSDVVGQMKNTNGVRIVRRPLDPLDAARIIGDADLVLSMNVDGLVLAMTMGRPFVNMGLTRKAQRLCEDAELGALSIPPYTITLQGLVRAVKEAEKPATASLLRDSASRQAALAAEEGQRFRAAVLGRLQGALAA